MAEVRQNVRHEAQAELWRTRVRHVMAFGWTALPARIWFQDYADGWIRRKSASSGPKTLIDYQPRHRRSIPLARITDRH